MKKKKKEKTEKPKKKKDKKKKKKEKEKKKRRRKTYKRVIPLFNPIRNFQQSSSVQPYIPLSSY